MKSVRLVAAAVACVMLGVTSARADDRSDAEKQFRAGVSLQKVEDFDAAIVAFEASLDLFPTRSALFNLANCLRAVHRYPDSLARFQELEEKHGGELTAAMRGEVGVQIAELENLTGSVWIRVDHEGAEVRVDGELVGRSPLEEPVRLGLGDHRLEASLDGFATTSRTFNLKPRDSVTEAVTLEPLSKRAPQPLGTPAPLAPLPRVSPAATTPPSNDAKSPSGISDEHGGARLTTPGWITAGTGAVLLVGGAVAGIWALSLDADLEGDCPGGHCPSARGSDIDRLETLATTSNVLFGLGAGATAAGVVMLLLDAEHRDPGVDRTAWSASIAPGGFAAGLRQRF